MARHGLLVLACLSLPGCTETIISNGTIGGAWGRHQTPVTYTTADVRMISERPDPMRPGYNLVCTEPLPDVAKVLSSAAQGQAKGGNGTVNVTLGGGYSSAEALLELAGRSTALLGLRDGLYRACEAYANGAIGDDAYSLVLSRYGAVMVTLFLAQDMQNAAAHATNTVQSPAISIGGAHVAPAAAAPADSEPAQKADKPGGMKTLAPAGGLPALLRRAGYPDSPLAGGLAPWAGQGPPLAAPRLPARIVPAKAVEPAAPDAAHDQATDGSAAVEQAISKLAEDYFASGRDALHILMVACINEYDTTRSAGAGHRNSFLDDVCPAFSDTRRLKSLADILDPVQDRPAPLWPAAPHPAPSAH